MKKHAFLIIAHKDDVVFRSLIKLLDDPRNDIFVHMDKKNMFYKKNQVEKSIKYSNIYHVKRTRVTWGGYSQINAELLLLKCATNMDNYSYYHLLSGSDLIIQPQNVFHNFFDNNQGKEFVRFEKQIFQYNDRVKLYHLFQELIGKKRNFFWLLNKLSLESQKKFKIKKKYAGVEFQKGSNWFSITDDLARYILEQENWIKKTFKYTFCCDEIFLQTIVNNSKFKKNLYHKEYDDSDSAIMRLIDWKQGKPYVFHGNDYERIANSDMLIARKFDSEVDAKVIQQICDRNSEDKSHS